MVSYEHARRHIHANVSDVNPLTKFKKVDGQTSVCAVPSETDLMACSMMTMLTKAMVATPTYETIPASERELQAQQHVRHSRKQAGKQHVQHATPNRTLPYVNERV